MKRVEAKIYLRNAKEGGLTERAFSGMQPSIEIAGDLLACRIIYGDEGTEMNLGDEYSVQVELPYESEASGKLARDFHFGLNIGGRVIGHGVVV